MTEKPHVLVVEDNEYDRALLQVHLTEEEFGAEFARDGVEAWTLLEDHAERYDVALLERPTPTQRSSASPSCWSTPSSTGTSASPTKKSRTCAAAHSGKRRCGVGSTLRRTRANASMCTSSAPARRSVSTSATRGKVSSGTG